MEIPNTTNPSSENYENAPPNIFSPSKPRAITAGLSPSPLSSPAKRAKGSIVDNNDNNKGRRNSMDNEPDAGNDSFLAEDFRSFTDFDDEEEEGEDYSANQEEEEEEGKAGLQGGSRVMDVDDVFQLDSFSGGLFFLFLLSKPLFIFFHFLFLFLQFLIFFFFFFLALLGLLGDGAELEHTISQVRKLTKRNRTKLNKRK